MVQATAASVAVLAVAAVAGLYWQGRAGGNAVAASDLVIARVQKGDLERAVRAPGVVVPTEIRWIAATVDGRVERQLVEAGAKVHADTLLMEMSSPTLARNLDTARIELEVLEAQALVLERQLSSDMLAQEAVIVDYELRFEIARVKMEANRSVRDLISGLVVRESEIAAERFEKRAETERARLVRLRELQQAQLHANQAELQRGRRHLQLQQELVDALSVRAGIEGTLQDVPIEVGQQVAIGTVLARVAGDDRYKVELRVQEAQAKEVAVGQTVAITAGGQQSQGRVSRVDPAVQDGTVLVDVSFTGATLPGARPDLRVQGLIETAFAADTLVLQRPVFSEENTTIDLFVVDGETGAAERRTVEVGLGSTDRVQILGGLGEGEAVIVSDVARFADRQRIDLAE